jgi:hypothetical protein
VINWPQPARWYATGRAALAALPAAGVSTATTWVPEYFCPNTTAYLRRHVRVRRYADDPSRPFPIWSSLRPNPGDIVVAVDYFGVRDATPWTAWEGRIGLTLVADQSHDPAGDWARRIGASLGFASLRKTLPVPDGAIVWSLSGRALPREPDRRSGASDAKLAAMLLKREYLDRAGKPDLKARFRELQELGERAIDRANLAESAALFTREYLSRGIPIAWRRRRRANVRAFLAAINGWRAAEPLFDRWPRDAAPLGAVLVFGSSAQRDRARERLRRADVYCPVHWTLAPGASPQASRLAGRILTIPSDQRYTSADMRRIARVLRGGTTHSRS